MFLLCERISNKNRNIEIDYLLLVLLMPLAIAHSVLLSMNDTVSEEELQFLLASWLAKRLFRGFCPDAGLKGLKRGLRSENVTDSTLIILYFLLKSI